MKKILVTGGAGYIGSHTLIELINSGYSPVVIDNLINSSKESIRRVEKITGEKVELIICDLLDKKKLSNIFLKYNFFCVIHFAALKAVAESAENPYKYYINNVSGALQLLNIMKIHDVHNFIFSSSATVYGQNADIPYVESMKLGTPSSPYGETKIIIERILKDISISDNNFRAISLRYFNPIGAYQSGTIGEDPNGIPNNLLPYILQVGIGRLNMLKVFGNDYPTKDGTCRRDYLHVTDLALGHLQALKWLDHNSAFRGIEAFNLGTGVPYSVLEIIETFAAVNKINIPYEFAPRRKGDLPEFWADPTKASEVLGWKANFSLEKMLEDSWRWQVQNPEGY